MEKVAVVALAFETLTPGTLTTHPLNVWPDGGALAMTVTLVPAVKDPLAVPLTVPPTTVSV